jgi:hypothetical protein
MWKTALNSVLNICFSSGSARACSGFCWRQRIPRRGVFNAIGDGNAAAIASFYADDAEFRWIGGPLAGVYKGKDKIRAVWEKFSEVAGKLEHEVLQLSEDAGGKAPGITATVKFKGDGEVPVKFAITYKNGKIASESWQVDRETAAYVQQTAPAAQGQTDSEPQAEGSSAPAIAPAPAAEAETAASQGWAAEMVDASNQGASSETVTAEVDSSYLPPAGSDPAPVAETAKQPAPAAKTVSRQTARAETKSRFAEVKTAYRRAPRESCAGHGGYADW